MLDGGGLWWTARLADRAQRASRERAGPAAGSAAGSLLLGAALAAATGPSPAAHRALRVLVRAGPAARPDPWPPGDPARPVPAVALTGPGLLQRAGGRRTAACLLASLASLLVVGGLPGVVLAGVCTVLGPRLLGRLEPRAVRDERERFTADLPTALDLLAACLRGGAAPAEAVRAVGLALPGACGDRLTRVAAALALGAPAPQAWGDLAGDGSDDAAVAAARALTRACEGGTPVADAVALLSAQSRDEAAARGQAAAARAGVLAVAPLGLCFLPAFVLLGVVPVVAGLVGPLLAGL